MSMAKGPGFGVPVQKRYLRPSTTGAYSLFSSSVVSKLAANLQPTFYLSPLLSPPLQHLVFLQPTIILIILALSQAGRVTQRVT